MTCLLTSVKLNPTKVASTHLQGSFCHIWSRENKVFTRLYVAL